MSHAFHAEKRKEKFYKLAKEQGYRSRAAFKLIQLNKRFNFLGGAKACLDLCAAPGGWLQIASKYMPVQSMIIGVDLLPIKPLPNVITFIEDITTQSCRTTIRKQLQGWQVDLVLHDGAPNVGGGNTWARDAYMQIELVLHSLKLATEFLVEGGTFVTKIFRSNDYLALVWVLKQFFKKVEVTKPIASRQASAEIFAVCLGYLAPKKIDPKLFDPQVVFKPTQIIEDREANVLSRAGKSSKPNRAGYDTDSQVLHTRKTVAEYIATKNPSDILIATNELYFDAASEIYKNHPSTTAEICELIKDLKLLGKSDFGALIKWHKKLTIVKAEIDRLAKKADDEAKGILESEVVIEEISPVEEEQRRSDALDELSDIVKARVRKEKKKKQEFRMKELRRLALNANNIKERIIDSDESLFNLRQVRTEEDMALILGDIGEKKADFIEAIGEDRFMKIISTSADGIDYSDDEIPEEDAESEDDSDLSDSEKRVREMEKSIDYLYGEYKSRKKIITKKDKRGLGLQSESAIKMLDSEDESDGGDASDAVERAAKQASTAKSGTGLVMDGADSSVTAQRWFSQDAFEGISFEDESMIPASLKARPVSTGAVKRTHDKVTVDDSDDSDSDSDDDVEDIRSSRNRWLANDEKNKGMGGSAIQGSKFVKDNQGGFEEVKMSDYSDDTDARAEVLALGTKMLRKKARNALIDAAYNKYAYNDRGELPEWFVEDENRHNRAQLPVTKQEVDALREQLKSINARPIKKIAEARARKKKGALRKVERMKIQANNIIEQDGVSASEKMKQVEKLYQTSRAKQKLKPVKHYVVSSKSGGGTNARSKTGGLGKPFIVRVDSRMKKDKRAADRKSNKKQKRK